MAVLPRTNDTVNVGSMRNLPRNYMALSVILHEAENPMNKGVVIDLTEKGVGVTGVQSPTESNGEIGARVRRSSRNRSYHF